MSKSKHDVWFPFIPYIDLHNKVLEGIMYTMLEPTEYDFKWIVKNKRFSLFAKFSVTTENESLIEVEIDKKAKCQGIKDGFPKEAKTITASYLARHTSGHNIIRYCFPHTEKFNQSVPYHDKFHKHDNTTGNSNVIILSESNFPHVSEFLKEVLWNL